MNRSHAVTLAHSTGTFHTHQRVPLHVCVFFISETFPNSFAEFKNVTRASSWERSNRSKVQFCVTNPFERDFVLSLVICFLFVLFTRAGKSLESVWRWCSGSRGFFPLAGKTEAPLEADGFYRLTTSDPCLSAWFGPRRLNSSLMCAPKSQVPCLLPHTCTKAILTPFPRVQVLEPDYLIHCRKDVKSHTLLLHFYIFSASFCP